MEDPKRTRLTAVPALQAATGATGGGGGVGKQRGNSKRRNFCSKGRQTSSPSTFKTHETRLDIIKFLRMFVKLLVLIICDSINKVIQNRSGIQHKSRSTLSSRVALGGTTGCESLEHAHLAPESVNQHPFPEQLDCSSWAVAWGMNNRWNWGRS
eukprot:4347512-Amphidinium_carterae.1